MNLVVEAYASKYRALCLQYALHIEPFDYVLESLLNGLRFRTWVRGWKVYGGVGKFPGALRLILR